MREQALDIDSSSPLTGSEILHWKKEPVRRERKKPMTKTARTKRTLLAAALVAGLFLVSTAPPAIGLRFSPYPGCGELCSRKFWPGASAKDVDAGLDKRPAARAYLRRMLRLAVKAGNAPATAALPKCKEYNEIHQAIKKVMTEKTSERFAASELYNVSLY